MELQDPGLVSTIRQQQKRVLEFWEKNWVKHILDNCVYVCFMFCSLTKNCISKTAFRCSSQDQEAC